MHVSGTVAATQSGPWNVQIVGTPLLVTSRDEPGRNPYQEEKVISCNTNECSVQFSQVPPGRRLAVTNISGVVTLVVPDIVRALTLASTAPGSRVFVPTHSEGVEAGPAEHRQSNQQILFYVDAPNSPTVSVHFGGTSVSTS